VDAATSDRQTCKFFYNTENTFAGSLPRDWEIRVLSVDKAELPVKIQRALKNSFDRKNSFEGEKSFDWFCRRIGVQMNSLLVFFLLSIVVTIESTWNATFPLPLSSFSYVTSGYSISFSSSKRISSRSNCVYEK
jgi:hypothetical protein